jgi:hypothetical protein
MPLTTYAQTIKDARIHYTILKHQPENPTTLRTPTPKTLSRFVLGRVLTRIDPETTTCVVSGPNSVPN